jgi:hypothetical protein
LKASTARSGRLCNAGTSYRKRGRYLTFDKIRGGGFGSKTEGG